MRLGHKSYSRVGRGILAAAVLAGCTLLPPGCGSLRSTAVPDDAPGLAAATQLPAARPPGGVDPRLWEALTTELEHVLALNDNAKQASGVPLGQASAVPDLSVNFDGVNNNYAWSYRQQGDYDLNGVVNASDLVRVGINFGKTTLQPGWLQAQLADGNGDGAVGIADVAPIGLNFNGRIDGYVLQSRPTSGDPWAILDAEPFVPGAPATGLYPQYSFSAAALAGSPQFRVLPFMQNGANHDYGVASNLAGWDADFDRYWHTARGNITRDGFVLANGPATLPTTAVSVPLANTGWVTMFNEPVADYTGTVYIGTCYDSDFSDTTPGWLYAVRFDGTMRWRFHTLAGISGAAACSRLARVVVGDLSGLVYCFAPDGKLCWQRQLSGAPALTSPLLADDGTVYIVSHEIIGGTLSSSTLYRLSPTGALDWSRELNGVSLTAPFFDPQGNIAIINDKPQLVSFTPAGVMQFQFALDDPLRDSIYANGAAIGGDIVYYSTEAHSVLGTAYNNSSTALCDLAGDVASTMPTLNILGDCIVGAVDPADHTAVYVEYFSNSSLVWKLSLAGSAMSNIATDVAGRMYTGTYIFQAKALTDNNGIHCLRQDQTKDWFYATGDYMPMQVALVADNRLACIMLGPGGCALLLLSGG